MNNEPKKSECCVGQPWGEGYTSDKTTDPNPNLHKQPKSSLVFKLSDVQNWFGNSGVKYLSSNTFNIFST